jgi:hypothetical protein
MASLVRVHSCRDFIMLLLCGFSLSKSLSHVILLRVELGACMLQARETESIGRARAGLHACSGALEGHEAS